MIAYKLGTEPIDLEVWGPPENLSAVTVSGEPIMHGITLFRAASGAQTGVYEVTKGVFTIVYPFHEHATVLSGELEVTDRDGNSTIFGPGDSWFCHRGEVVTWNVLSDRLRKSFFVTDQPASDGETAFQRVG